MEPLVADILSKFNAKGFKAAEKSIRKFDRQMYKVQRATMAFSVAIAGVGAIAGKMSMEFDESMGKIVSLVGIGRDEVNAWKKDILKLAPAVGKSPKELADAMFFITSAGLKGEVALNALEMSAKASAAGLGETKSIADAVTSAIGAYGEEAMTASKATDILTATVRLGKLEAAELTPVIGRVLLSAKSLGISFNEVGAAMAALSRKGLNAAEAGTSLRGVFMALLKTTPKGEAELKKVGLSFEKLKLILKEEGLLKFLEIMNKHFKDNADGLAKVIPRGEALTAVFGLIGSNMETTTEIMKDMNDVAGETQTAFGKSAQEDIFKWRQAIIGINAGVISLGSTIMPLVIPLIEKFTKIVGVLVKKFTELSPSMKSTIVNFMALIAVLGPITFIISKLSGLVVVGMSLLSGLIPMIFTLTESIMILWTTVKAVGAWQVFVGLIVTATGAITLLGIAIFMWVKDWDRLSKGIVTISKWVADENVKIFKSMFNIIGIDIEAFIKKYWDKLKKFGQGIKDFFTFGDTPVDGNEFFKRLRALQKAKREKAKREKAEREKKAKTEDYTIDDSGFEMGPDPMEDYNRRTKEIYSELENRAAVWGQFIEDVSEGAFAGAQNSVNKFFTAFRQGSIQAGKLFKGVMESIFNSLMSKISQIIAKWLVLNAVAGLTGGPGVNIMSVVAGSFAEGGAVKKTGAYLVHAGEFVLPSDVVDSIKKGNPPSSKMTPAMATGGANVNITQNISLGSGGGDDDVSNIMEKITEATKNGVRQAVDLAKVSYKTGNKKANESI